MSRIKRFNKDMHYRRGRMRREVEIIEDESEGENTFSTSMRIGMMTNSSIMGGIIGKNLLGGIIGDLTIPG